MAKNRGMNKKLAKITRRIKTDERRIRRFENDKRRRRGKIAVKQNYHPAHQDFYQRAVKTYLNPHDNQGRVTGLGMPPYDPSQKVSVKVTFDTTAGSNGITVVGVAPNLANDSQNIIYSNAATFAGTTVPTLNSAATGTSVGLMSGLPYTSAQLGNSLRGRVVSMSLTAHYTGTVLNCGGLLYMASSPQWGSLDGMSTAGLTVMKTHIKDTVKYGKKYYMNSIPATNAQGSYGSVAQVTGASAMPLVMIVVGNANATFHCEVSMVVEYTGVTCDHSSTKNPVPPPGAHDIIATACSDAKVWHNANPDAHHSEVENIALKAVTQQTGIPLAGKGNPKKLDRTLINGTLMAGLAL